MTMASNTITVLATSTTSAFSSPLRKDSPTMKESEMQVEPERPAFEVTSNARHDSQTPEPSSMEIDEALFPQHPSDAVADDPMYGLPPPSPAPRFVFRPYISEDEDTTSFLMTDGSSDTAPPTQASTRTPSFPPPRIYFGPSAITFVSPVSSDFLERDPNVKGVPRNYRAWGRTGRPKLDVEGAERPEAKDDFRAMGLTFPPDSDSEGGGDEGVEAEKRKKKRKKKQTAKAMVPIDRPRRTMRKLLETATPAAPPLQTKVVNEKRVEKRDEAKLKPVAVVSTINAVKKGPSSKSTAESDSSGRRSSSTLLDTDNVEMNKRKRLESDKDIEEIPAAKRLRISKRLHAKRNGPRDDGLSSELPTEDEEEKVHSSSDLSPSPPSPVIVVPRTAPFSERRKSSPPPPHLILRTRVASGQSALASSSRSAPLPASRPGHRLARDALPNVAQAVPIRTFPPSLPIIPGYSSFYRRYPLITQFHPDDLVGKHINQNDTPRRALGIWNPPRDYRDLYTPRYTKGSGGKKIALCPICFEDPARGGEGRQEWNHTKTSQHNYHMQYYHGVSATRCAPFSPPIAQRTYTVPRPQTNEKSQILQGKCHVCKQWISLEGCKVGELKVKELLWWKHAAQCHKDSQLGGEDDIFIEDVAFRQLKEYESAHPEEV